MTASNSTKSECPNCRTVGFSRASQTVTLDGTLHEWEIQGALTFPPAVWEDYAKVLDKQLHLHRCDQCQFQQFVPPMAGTGSFYAAITGEDAAYYTQNRWEFRKAIRTISNSGAQTVLDAGCGGGAFLQQLRKAGSFNSYGYDFNPQTQQILTAQGLGVVDNLEDSHVEGGFDVVTCFQVLEHLENPWSFGALLRKQLKKGGLLIVTTPDAAGPIQNFTDSVTDLPPHHVSRWNANAMEAFGARFGFKTRRILHEPLPSYVWRYYLPVMIRNSRIPGPIKNRLIAKNRVERFLGVMEWLGVTELPPLGGHSLYAEFEG